MGSEILIHVTEEETKVAIIEDDRLVEYFFDRKQSQGIVGNIYKGKVSKVLPGMQAAFVDIGLEKAAFLYVDDIFVEGTEILPDALRDDALPAGPDESSSATKQLEESAAEPAKRPGRKPIEEIINDGQELLIQTTKDPISTKGPRATTYISLPGRYLVYMPQVNHIGVSRRITNEPERQRLKEIVSGLRTHKGGYIIRTVAEGMTEDEARMDMVFLDLLWEDIKSKKEGAKAPALVRVDLDVVFRTIRDYLTSDVTRLVLDNQKEFQRVLDFVKTYLPAYTEKIQLWNKKTPLFQEYSVDQQVARALEKKVWLKSGGYLVIDRAEALTVVDVNTGRFVGENDPEETILKTNLEAVDEITHQLRLRNIGGIIILDFIDMEKEKNRERVFQGLQELLTRDKARTNALKISDLGLVEMSRKRVREDLVHLLGETCAYCDGKGYVKSVRTIIYEIFEELRKLPNNRGGRDRRVILYVHPDIEVELGSEKLFLDAVQQMIRRKVIVKSDPLYHIEEFVIVSP
ncbi:MAG: Rne/Rng family ribonuclease [Nitrospirota bacterium]|nr:Rne/Rng family ribonuclease [Nitrospirota bacterium]